MIIAAKEKYVSEKRGAPRILQATYCPPAGEPRRKRSPIDPARGILTYSHIDGYLSEIFEASTDANLKVIGNEFQQDVDLVRRSLDLQYCMASEFFWIIEAEPYARVSDVQQVLEPCFKNNLLALKSAETVTRQGLYSLARPTLRMVFESLMIAKFCSSNRETEVYDKWVDGKVVYFTNGVIKKIIKPDAREFNRFWSLISECTHSSIYAMQPDSCIDNVREQINLNYLLIHMLSECNYHLLNSHIITKSQRYYQKRYGKPDSLSAWRKELVGIYSLVRSGYNKPAKDFIRNFKFSWIVQSG